MQTVTHTLSEDCSGAGEEATGGEGQKNEQGEGETRRHGLQAGRENGRQGRSLSKVLQLEAKFPQRK